MTPAETNATIEAANWRMERKRKLYLSTAWHAAALSRAKRMPRLRRLLEGEGETRILKGEELERRRREKEEMMRAIDIDKLNEAMKRD